MSYCALSYNLLSTYCVVDTYISALHSVLCLILAKINLWVWILLFPFDRGETEAQRDQVTFPVLPH